MNAALTHSAPPPPAPAAPSQDELARVANRLRRDVIRMVHAAGCGHPGGPLGLADLFAALYFAELRVDPAHPDHPSRDRLVLSNGHCCAILYSALARRGFFEPASLASFRKMGSPFQGHPHYGHLPGVEMSTGSLGNGVSVAAGMALGHKIDGNPGRVYAVTSDGENEEGQVWEMATSSTHYELGNLTLILDWNGIQIDGPTKQVMDTGDLSAKWRAFGWHVQEIDGHDLPTIRAALRAAEDEKHRPSILCCRTTIGKGVSYMEDTAAFHGKAPSDEECVQALRELGDPEPESLDHEDARHWRT